MEIFITVTVCVFFVFVFSPKKLQCYEALLAWNIHYDDVQADTGDECDWLLIQVLFLTRNFFLTVNIFRNHMGQKIPLPHWFGHIYTPFYHFSMYSHLSPPLFKLRGGETNP